jgi:hypothetical protein
MVTALVLFGVAAVGGLILATQRLKGAPQPSLPLALVHGGVVAAGLGPDPRGGRSGCPSVAKTALVVPGAAWGFT